MDEKAIKKIIQKEVNPLLIGIRNDLSQNLEVQKAIEEQLKKNSQLEYELEVDNDELKGADGHTPTADELTKLIIPLIPPAQKGDDGHTPTADELKALIVPLIPAPKEPTYTKVLETVQPVLKRNFEAYSRTFEARIAEIKAAIPTYKEITAQQIVEKLESLKGARRLDAKAIKGLEKYIQTIIVQSGGGGAASGGGSGVSTFLALTDTPNSYASQGGKGVRVKGTEDGLEFYTTTDSDEKVKVSANDTTAGYLNGKLVAGSGISFTENNDGGDETLTIDSTITQYTDEQAQDAVGNILTDTATIDFTYNDTTPTITADVIDNSITFAKMQDITTNKLIGRHSSGNGDPEEVGVDGGLEINGSNIRRSALTGDVTANAGSANTTIANNAVTNAKLADMATSTIKGRATAGTGDPEDLTATQVRTILNVEDGAEVNNISDTNATDLTDGGDTTLHYHSSDRNRANHTGTQTASTISDFDTEVSNNTDVAANTTARHTHANKAILDNITASFTTAQETKLSHISVTQAVDLDQMETDIAALANGMVYKGDWDASDGTFPGSGSAQTGWFYYVSVAGTVDSVSFAVGDNIVATTDNASTTTYTGNWSKHDQTDAVSSVNSQVGAVVLDADDIDDTSTTHKFTTASDISKLAGIEAGAEVNNISDTNATDLTDGGDSTLHYHASDRNRANHTGTQTASTISDFDIEVSNNTDVVANTSARHNAVTVTDTDDIDHTLTGQDLQSTIKSTAISNKTLKSTLSGTEEVLVNDAGTLKKTTAQDIADLAGGVSDGDKGDITVSGSGATWTVDNNAITYAKIQDVNSDRLLGRDTAGSGDVEEITVSGGLEFTGSGGIQRSALTGEVTASAGSNSTVLNVTAITNKLGVTVPGLSDQMLIETGGALKKISLTNLFSIFGQVPIGGVIDWAGTTLPTGYLYCDGSVISRTSYADLFAVIGTTYGAGDGSTTFGLPDCRGRVTAGVDNMNNAVGTGGGDAGRLTSTSKAGVDGDTLGASGGVQEHLLLWEESGLKAHTHGYADRYRAAISNRQAGSSNTNAGSLTFINATTSANTAEDADEAHTNVQPTLVLNKIIRFGL